MSKKANPGRSYTLGVVILLLGSLLIISAGLLGSPWTLVDAVLQVGVAVVVLGLVEFLFRSFVTDLATRQTRFEEQQRAALEAAMSNAIKVRDDVRELRKQMEIGHLTTKLDSLSITLDQIEGNLTDEALPVLKDINQAVGSVRRQVDPDYRRGKEEAEEIEREIAREADE